MSSKHSPRRKPSKPSEDKFTLNAAKMIDAEFSRMVWVTIGPKRKRVSVFHAIFLQLAHGATQDRRALRVLSRYVAYAKSRGALGGRVRLVFPPKQEVET